jgi:hypothetical protein
MKSETERDRALARIFWESLSHHERWEVGDQLVLGEFDALDWADRFPGIRVSGAFLGEIDRMRILWEDTAE